MSWKSVTIGGRAVKKIMLDGGVLFEAAPATGISYTGSYEGLGTYTIDGESYGIYRLTTSGTLVATGDVVKAWLCGGGASGTSAKTAQYVGDGGDGAKSTSGTLTSEQSYAVVIGVGGATAASGGTYNAGTDTTIGSISAAGATLTNHGSGGGGANSGGQGHTGDGVSTYPFGLTSLLAHCAGGGGGMQTVYYHGGDGGTNGGNGEASTGSGPSTRGGTGGVYGGGWGGGASHINGYDAAFYGSAGGGGGPDAAATGGAGYQGCAYIAILGDSGVIS